MWDKLRDQHKLAGKARRGDMERIWCWQPGKQRVVAEVRGVGLGHGLKSTCEDHVPGLEGGGLRPSPLVGACCSVASASTRLLKLLASGAMLATQPSLCAFKSKA